MAKWQCDACGEAESCDDVFCIVETWAGEPEYCPVSGDDCCKWYPVEG